MAGKREDLSVKLHAICDNVYFQPSSDTHMKYPCIVYSLSNEKVMRANNHRYANLKRYSVTVVDRDADSVLPDLVGDLLYCSFDRVYTADGFYHYAYTLYF